MQNISDKFRGGIKKRLGFALLVGCALFLALSLMAHVALAAGQDKVSVAVMEKLQRAGQSLVQHAASHVQPQKKAKAVRREGQGFVAHYVEVDVQSLHAEIHPASSPEHPVGMIKYLEYDYQCRGATEAAARQAPCVKVYTRRMTEILGYADGAWSY